MWTALPNARLSTSASHCIISEMNILLNYCNQIFRRPHPLFPMSLYRCVPPTWFGLSISWSATVYKDPVKYFPYWATPCECTHSIPFWGRRRLRGTPRGSWICSWRDWRGLLSVITLLINYTNNAVRCANREVRIKVLGGLLRHKGIAYWYELRWWIEKHSISGQYV
jgi:hypothetical protein